MAGAHKFIFPNFLSLFFHGGCGAALPPPHPSDVLVHKRAPPSARLTDATALVVEVDGGLLLSSGSLFPYFMLVATEAGGLLRGLLLLLLYPFIAFIGGDMAVRAMAFVAFCGLRATRFRAGRAVLPRWLLEDVGLEAFDAVRRRASGAAGRRAAVVWASRMPRVMVEPFLKEYLEADVADVVAAREMTVLWGLYTGLMEEGDGEAASEARKKIMEGPVGDDVVGFSGGSMEFLCNNTLSSSCKEVYVVSAEEKSKWRPLPRHEYPRPLVFHDGRLAFLPTPLATVAMLVWLPLGAALAVTRIAVAMALPYKYATLILAATGQSWRLRGSPPLPPSSRGQLYVCNHRTLIDPVYVSIALDRPVRAVSYSLSRLSELISPIGRTVHLARDRAHDGAAMARLLAGGAHVVVCPEGTTCREPYLLRFSPLFAELSGDGVVPVALAVETAMFHGTTAGGWKSMDALYYLGNPRMCYTVEFLGRVDTAPVRDGSAASTDVANRVQRLMATSLGYECTMLTRKDKYLMLAGNDGVVRAKGAAC
ncbi:probable glycerol-3-phosphate acyltransferase 3 [Triticum dicoccoides]|uniref:probable glycerol-3-phosphate acyltransferase 3 n=1 Tax=Triticum dicoccoides TaxID=85692 RepID=UPI00188FA962|nr:probable glycerol-3-phosphate acyltransferase 3 [Triticum dicoccoides]